MSRPESTTAYLLIIVACLLGVLFGNFFISPLINGDPTEGSSEFPVALEQPDVQVPDTLPPEDVQDGSSEPVDADGSVDTDASEELVEEGSTALTIE